MICCEGLCFENYDEDVRSFVSLAPSSFSPRLVFPDAAFQLQLYSLVSSNFSQKKYFVIFPGRTTVCLARFLSKELEQLSVETVALILIAMNSRIFSFSNFEVSFAFYVT